MALRVPLIDSLPGPRRLAVIYLVAALFVCALFYAGLALENLALVVASVFGASFWLFSLGFVLAAAVLKAMRTKRTDRR